MDYTKEFIQEQFTKLPPELKEALSSVSVIHIIEVIARQNELMLDQAEELAEAVGLTILGVYPGEDFSHIIQEKLEIDRAAADIITQQVNDHIFLEIRSALKTIRAHKIDFDEEKKNQPEVRKLTPKPAAPLFKRVTKDEPKRSDPEKKASLEEQAPTKPPEVKAEAFQQFQHSPIKAAPTPVPPPPPKPESQNIAYVAPRQGTAQGTPAVPQTPNKKTYMDPYLMNRDRLLYELENPSGVPRNSPYSNVSATQAPAPSVNPAPVPTQPYSQPSSAPSRPMPSPTLPQTAPQMNNYREPIPAVEAAEPAPAPAPQFTPAPTPQPVIQKPPTPAPLPPPPPPAPVPPAPTPKIEEKPAEIKKPEPVLPPAHPELLPELMPEQHLAIKKGETAHNVPIPKENQVPIKDIKEINLINHKLNNVVAPPKIETLKTDQKKDNAPIKLIPKNDPYRESV